MQSTPPNSTITLQEDQRQKRLDRLSGARQEALAVVQATDEPDDQVHLLQDWYFEAYGDALNRQHARRLCQRAILQLNPKRAPLQAGDTLDCTPTRWLWEGMIMQGAFNLIVGAPKVGKSALMTALIGALHRGDEELLGRKVSAANCPPVIIVGTDQPESNWVELLKREDLAIGNVLQEPIKRLYRAGDGIILDSDGLDEIEKLANEHPGALFVFDSYDSLAGPLGVEESSAIFARPARLLMDRLAPTGATFVILHHTNKSVSGGSAISASRGSNALPAAASWCLLLNWLKQVPEGQTQTDFRVMVLGQGRASSQQMLTELQGDGTDCRWALLGSATDAMRQERLYEAEMTMPDGRKSDVLDYVRMRFEVGSFGVTAKEIADTMNLKKAKANKCLEQLVHEGLVKVSRGAIPTDPETGGRPANLYWYHLAADNCVVLPPQGGVKGYLGDKPSRVHENKGFIPFNPLITGQAGTDVCTPYAGGLTPGSKVEILMSNGEWQNSWVMVDGSNPDACSVEKLGMPALTRSNLRWGLDVRACEAIDPEELF